MTRFLTLSSYQAEQRFESCFDLCRAAVSAHALECHKLRGFCGSHCPATSESSEFIAQQLVVANPRRI